MKSLRRCLVFLAFTLWPVFTVPAVAGQITVARTNYRGWADSLVLGNGQVEAVIVPAIGRVMQFRFVGEADGPFWENRALDGRSPDARSKEWGNFGGDKTWPAPQADWDKVTDRSWPPPPAFDSQPVEARVFRRDVELVSPVDSFYGIRTRRKITLDPRQPVMRITTRFEKVEGAPRHVGVWVITQLAHPELVAAPVPKGTIFPEGFNRQSGEQLPLGLRVTNGLITLQRDPRHSTKIGNDAGALVWIGPRQVLRIDSPRRARAEYPDQGSSAEVYTNPDPNAYVELELLGPLRTLHPGDHLERTSTYTLFRRCTLPAEAEARRVLEAKPRRKK